jgi:chromosome segregation ATPase
MVKGLKGRRAHQLDTPIARALINELESLDRELNAVSGERPQLEEFSSKLQTQIDELSQRLRSKEEALAAAIAANAAIAEMGNRNAAAARIVGRVSLFLETYRPDDDLIALENRVKQLQALVVQLEGESGADDRME